MQNVFVSYSHRRDQTEANAKDIFLSYAEEDFDRVQGIVSALKGQGWSVFIDREDVSLGSNFRKVISQYLEAAACVVVVWSRHSVKSDYVIEEAASAKERLIPVKIDDVPLPYGFRERQTKNLVGWDGNAASPALIAIYREINKQLAQPRSAQPDMPTDTSPRSVEEDGATGLITRPLFYDRLRQAILQGNRSGTRFAVLFLDLDNFKAINDRWGHAAGDQLLFEVAKRLKESVRSGDTVARLHGDEFAIILQNLHTAYDAARIGSKILESVAAPLEFRDLPSTVSVSVGIALYPQDGDDGKALLRAADLALYDAKNQGRNVFRFFTRDLEAEALKRLGFEQDLRKALAEQEFVLHYQPKICLATGQVVAVEALLRWNHYARGLVMPRDFVPLLEEKRLIPDVGEWVLRQACRQYKEWASIGLAPSRIAINVSACELRQKDFAPRVSEILQQTGVAPSVVEFEFDASLVFEDHLARKALEAIRKIGIFIALDEFATRYPVQTLHDYSIDSINIETTAVGRVANDSIERAIVEKLIELGNTLELQVVAEGVEDCQTDEILKGLGCRFGQGFFYCPPLPSEDLTKWLRKGPIIA